MVAVLTIDSDVLCGTEAPTAHGGTVAISSTAKLTVNNAPVLLETSVVGQTVSGCSTPDDMSKGTVSCQLVSAITRGQATKLTVGTQPVLLASVVGQTTGAPPGTPSNPPGTLSAEANQTKLTAI